MSKIIKFLKPFAWWAILVVTLIAGQTLLELWLPDLMSEVIKQIQGGTTNQMLRLGGQALGVAAAITAIAVVAMFISSRVAAGVGKVLRARIFRKVQSFTLSEIDAFGTASLITRSTNDITQVTNVLVFMMRMVIMCPIMLVGGVVMSIRKGGSLTLVIACTLPLMLLLMAFMMIYAVPQFKSMQKKIDALTVAARERLTGVRVIRAFNNETYSEERFDKENKSVTDTAVRVNKIMAFMMPAVNIIFSFTIVAIYWVGLLQADSIGYVANLTAVVQYAIRIMMSFMMLAMLFVMLPRAAVSAARIDAVLNAAISIPD
ncbi:MAG: ABC transporter ATP-binding protein, partial [Firmicutes bacterium]|nr:ABC transporter ATP-binding protein [Bacillota bacterium]